MTQDSAHRPSPITGASKTTGNPVPGLAGVTQPPQTAPPNPPPQILTQGFRTGTEQGTLTLRLAQSSRHCYSVKASDTPAHATTKELLAPDPSPGSSTFASWILVPTL
jgi:hypothetical protein